jgi:aldose 1-epimerase
VGGTDVSIPANFGGHAIHGLVFDKKFSVADRTDNSVAMTCDLGAVGWPFGGSLLYRVGFAPRRLTLSARIEAGRAAPARAMPVSLGWHPYFARPHDGDLAVTVTSDHVLETGDDLIPTGRLVPVEGDTDLHRGPVLGDRRLDHVYARARSPAIVTWPDLQLTLHFDPPIETIVVYTPPHAACVEPQTAWPNAPALHASGIDHTGLRTAAPGEAFDATTT